MYNYKFLRAQKFTVVVIYTLWLLRGLMQSHATKSIIEGYGDNKQEMDIYKNQTTDRP